jgi:methionyl-tRNA synthetase
LNVGLNPEPLRYYFAAKTSDGVDDLDLNLDDYVARVNADLVGKFVNIASRCAGFIAKRFDNQLASNLPDPEMYSNFVQALEQVRQSYADGEYNQAIRQIMALADEANRYIDEKKPWVVAKQEGADAELQAICTQGLNLFRVLALGLKPVLPWICTRAAEFLNSEDARWDSISKPLLAHRINEYQPLLTRIDPKHIEAMIEASKESLQPSPTATNLEPKKTSTASPSPQSPTSSPAFINIDDFAKLDLRIGKVLECGFVDGSDKLLRFKLDAGDLGERQIFSGIRASYAEPEKLIGRNVVFIANLAPRKMRFGVSEGMILSAGFDGGDLSLLDVDAGAAPGMPVK